MLLKHRPEMVLMDVRMPILTGDSLCRLVRPIAPKMKIALYSGLDESKLKELVVTSGADGYIQKAEDLDAFVRAVGEFLE